MSTKIVPEMTISQENLKVLLLWKHSRLTGVPLQSSNIRIDLRNKTFRLKGFARMVALKERLEKNVYFFFSNKFRHQRPEKIKERPEEY